MNRNEANEWIENIIGAKGAGMISEALKCNCSLTQLNMSGDEMYGIDNVIGIWGLWQLKWYEQEIE